MKWYPREERKETERKKCNKPQHTLVCMHTLFCGKQVPIVSLFSLHDSLFNYPPTNESESEVSAL